MKKFINWMTLALFVVIPIIFTLFFFIYNFVALNPSMYRVKAVYFADSLCYFLPFTLIGITIILKRFCVEKKVNKIIMRLSGVLFIPFIVVQYFDMIAHLINSAPQYLPRNYIIKALIAFFSAVYCFLPEKFIKIKCIPLILSIIAITALCSSPVVIEYFTYQHMPYDGIINPIIKFVIKQILIGWYPYVSIMLCSLFDWRQIDENNV